MKGVVFNLLEEVVRREYGEDAWDDLLEQAGLDGSYTSLGSYPDEQLQRLVGRAATLARSSEEATLRWFGRQALGLLAERYGGFFEGHRSTRSFLLTLNTIIHPEVRKVYPGADVPVFDYEASTDGPLVMGYRSARRLCAFGEGLIEGAAAHFGERVTIDRPKCMRRGDSKCVFRITFEKLAA